MCIQTFCVLFFPPPLSVSVSWPVSLSRSLPRVSVCLSLSQSLSQSLSPSWYFHFCLYRTVFMLVCCFFLSFFNEISLWPHGCCCIHIHNLFCQSGCPHNHYRSVSVCLTLSVCLCLSLSLSLFLFLFLSLTYFSLWWWFFVRLWFPAVSHLDI